ncbi:hypothetical protein [Streptomyces sp. NPDC057257]|uniref:hypothetical protein n=1 Tax=Streptomyces sp. NPDC057257 TaxID=3346071 RepID=UPI003640CCD6
MPIDIEGIRSRLTSHAQDLGVFGQVLDHEPVSAPGSGLTYAVWLGEIAPSPQNSGLASTSARVTFNGRLYLPADTEPMGDVDLQLGAAVDQLIGAYSGGFTLGGSVRNLDLLGAGGEALRAPFRYLQLDSTTYRTAHLNIPMILSNVWAQAS